MSKHRVRTGLALLPLAGTSVAGMALLSGGMLPAGPTDPTRPEVRLTSVECQIGDPQIGDPLCAYPLASIGSSGSGSTLTAIATPSASATGGPFSFLVGNGTADSPNAGLLIGDGYSYTADDVGQTPLCVASKPCNGGNAGLLFGKGGNGYDGGSGGNAYFYGRGGNGGNAVDFGVPGEDNFGGNGGNGGFLGGTDPAGNFFAGGGGNGGNGINGGNGGNGGSAGFFGIAVGGNGGKGGNGGDGTAANPNGGNGGNGGNESLFPLLYGGDGSGVTHG
ncbi:MAG: hypothetical protein WBD88_15930, partial [Mycobacterium sp.]